MKTERGGEKTLFLKHVLGEALENWSLGSFQTEERELCAHRPSPGRRLGSKVSNRSPWGGPQSHQGAMNLGSSMGQPMSRGQQKARGHSGLSRFWGLRIGTDSLLGCSAPQQVTCSKLLVACVAILGRDNAMHQWSPALGESQPGLQSPWPFPNHNSGWEQETSFMTAKIFPERAVWARC